MGLRILTGIIGAPVLLLFIFKGGIFFAGLVFLLVTLGIGEYGKMVTAKGYQFQIIPVILSAWTMVITAYCGFKDWASLGLMLLFLSIFFLAIIKYPRYEVSDIAVHFLGVIYIGWTMSHLLLLNKMEDGTLLILYLFFAIWGSDSGAYFVGKFLGKNKLCPSVSPKKTIEGSVGGIATTCLLLYLLNMYCGLLPNYSIFIIGIVISIVGQIGDLIESLIKRFCGVKDSGNILPGHGGILDRFDSIMLAAPFMYYCIYLVQYLG